MNISKFQRLWMHYQKQVTSGELSDFYDLGLTGLDTKKQTAFVSAGTKENAILIVERLLEQWTSINHRGKGQNMDDDLSNEQKIFKLGLRWLDATEKNDVALIKTLINDGFPINFQHPEYKEDALHIAAAGNYREIIDLLINTGECDYLLRDARGKLAWNNAEFFGHNEATSTLLLGHTKAQANIEGIDLRKEHTQHLRQWFHQPWYLALSNDDNIPTLTK